MVVFILKRPSWKENICFPIIAYWLFSWTLVGDSELVPDATGSDCASICKLSSSKWTGQKIWARPALLGVCVQLAERASVAGVSVSGHHHFLKNWVSPHSSFHASHALFVSSSGRMMNETRVGLGVLFTQVLLSVITTLCKLCLSA